MTTLSPASTRPTTIKKLACLAALLTLAMPTVGGCSSANSNPLIGSWKFSSTTSQYGPAGCSSTFLFTDKMATITTPPSIANPAVSVSTIAVKYVPSPTLVSVMTNAPGHVNYNIADKNHMYTEDPFGKCYYERTN